MMIKVNEVNKYLRAAKWNFNKAIELARKNMIVGEINFPPEKKVRTPRRKQEPPPPEE